jgi:hypothetical protein
VCLIFYNHYTYQFFFFFIITTILAILCFIPILILKLSQAWRLWVENHVLDLMDSALHEVCNANQFVKCVNVGLLCVQEDPNDRPMMSNVFTMLDSEATTIPTPKQPAFVPWRGHPIIASSSSQPELTSSLGGR